MNQQNKALRVLFLLLSFLGGFGEAQADPPRTSGDVVQAQGFPSLKPVHPDSVFSVAILVTIAKDWHVNARQGLPEYFIPVELSLDSSAPASLSSGPLYPAGEKKALAGAAQGFPVYQDRVTLTADVRLGKDVRPGSLSLPFRLRVQACNNQVCLQPGEVKVSVPLEVASLNQPVAPNRPDLFQSALASQGEAAEPENIIAQALKKNGIFLTFLLIFLGGLALNLTPCVYPMIPLTISYFGGRKAGGTGSLLGRAAAYVIGISMTYSTLGVTAALTGKILGSTLQSPWVLSGISILLVVLSLSMFGLYEIQAPGWLLNKVAGGTTEGWWGALGMGLVFGIVAAPCVDPFSIGLLTFVAAKADPLLGFFMFFTLSLGLGFPYLWLGFFSAEIQKLPKSGMWMVWVKKVFGLILLGMPLYFLNPLLPKNFSRAFVPGYFIFCGFLLAWVFSGAGVTKGFKRFQQIFGIVLIALGAFVFQAWPQPRELPFKDYAAKWIEQARREKKPVFIDFSASWCLPCKELEVRTFSDPKTHEALKDWILLKADLSSYSSAPVEDLKKAYGIMGVPTLVFIGKDGVERANLRAVGFISVGGFLERIGTAEGSAPE